MIARQIPGKNREFSVRVYRSRKPDEHLKGYGENYFVAGPLRGQVLIRAFREGTYWRKTLADKSLVVGEALDPLKDEELNEVLASRRAGDIYGRWYSKFCPEGEIGYAHFSEAEKISRDDFDMIKKGFCRG